jgi:hypothetical protein
MESGEGSLGSFLYTVGLKMLRLSSQRGTGGNLILVNVGIID